MAGNPGRIEVSKPLATCVLNGGFVSDEVLLKPYVSDDAHVAEFTPKAIIFGVIFGIIFGASTVYLALRAGLTVSASIPIAVVAISLLKKFGGSTILGWAIVGLLVVAFVAGVIVGKRVGDKTVTQP